MIYIPGFVTDGEDVGLVRGGADIGGGGIKEFVSRLIRHTKVLSTGAVFYAAHHPGIRRGVTPNVVFPMEGLPHGPAPRVR